VQEFATVVAVPVRLSSSASIKRLDLAYGKDRKARIEYKTAGKACVYPS
jgi:hypothetical protein